MNFIKHNPIEASLCLVLALLFLLFAHVDCQAETPHITYRQNTVRVVLDDNYPPYAFRDGQGQLKGIIVDQWGLWEKRTGLRVELTGMDWIDAQRRMQAGEYDVIDTIFRNEQRDLIYEFTKPYAKLEVPLFFHIDISGIQGPDDLKGFLVAAKSGDNSIEILKKHGVTNIAEYPSYEKLIEAARDGKAKVFTVDRPPALYFLNKMGIQGSFHETKPLYHGEFHRAVRRGNTNLLKVVEDGFADIPKSAYETVDKRWMGSPITESPYLRYALYCLGGISSIALLLTAWLWILKRAVSRKTLELSKSEEHHRAILQAAMSGIWLVDTSGRILEVNRAYCRMSGYSEQELLVRSISDLEANETPEQTASRIRGIIEKGESHFESRHMRKDGTLFDVEVSVQYRPDNGGQCVAFLQDITPRKQAEKEKLALEQQLQQTQKLESLGVLAGGIAHDFNNILSIIIGHCELLKIRPEKREDNIHQIEKAVERAAELCRQMLTYAGKAKTLLTQVNLTLLVDEMVRMLRATIPQNAVIRSELQADIPLVWGDTSQLRQIVMNLIINAVEAIGEAQGEVGVSLTKAEIRERKLVRDHLGKAIPAGWYVCLEVTDNGCGMDEETSRRIFEPFYTTKFTGRGLGMSAALGIITAHKGALQLFTKPGLGSTFRVFLPARESDSAKGEAVALELPDHWQGVGTILLVEDEELIKPVAKAMLEMLGFSVLEAANGREALNLYRERAQEITLVMTDMGMPVMDGYELIHSLKELDPGLPIIISSGFGDADVTSRLTGEDITGMVSKPYNFEQLREVLKKCLKHPHDS